ncbi:MAG: hypothetical protein AMXMBFR58_36680 [Phycisphaerae bacterium]
MLLRYPGGQTFLAPKIRHALPQQRTELRDPFFGAGGLLFEAASTTGSGRPNRSRSASTTRTPPSPPSGRP